MDICEKLENQCNIASPSLYPILVEAIAEIKTLREYVAVIDRLCADQPTEAVAHFNIKKTMKPAGG